MHLAYQRAAIAFSNPVNGGGNLVDEARRQVSVHTAALLAGQVTGIRGVAGVGKSYWLRVWEAVALDAPDD